MKNTENHSKLIDNPKRYDNFQYETAGGEYVLYSDYARINERWEFIHTLDSLAIKKQKEEIDRLKAEVERLKAVSTIEQRTIQGLQQTPEWSEIARLTAYCRELEGKVSHLDLFKSVVEKFFNSADLKNPPDAQSCYALAEKLKQLPDSILDFTEEQVRDNPAWALAVFRHKVKEMQYKRIHDLNAIGGEQEENARLKDDIKRRTAQYNGIIDTQLKVIDELKAEVDIVRKDRDLLFASHKVALEDIRRLHWDLRAAKEGKQSE